MIARRIPCDRTQMKHRCAVGFTEFDAATMDRDMHGAS